jgi:Colicin V production protein
MGGQTGFNRFPIPTLAQQASGVFPASFFSSIPLLKIRPTRLSRYNRHGSNLRDHLPSKAKLENGAKNPGKLGFTKTRFRIEDPPFCRFRPMNSPSAAQLAGESAGFRLPGISPIFWLAVLIGPTSYLYWSGDLVAAVSWALLTAAGWLGASLGLFRPVSWMISMAIACGSSVKLSSLLAPKIQSFAGTDERLSGLIALSITFFTVVALLHLFVCRPLQNYISEHPTFCRINSFGGFTLAFGKTLLSVVVFLSGILYLNDHPEVVSKVNATSLGEKINLPSMIEKTATATRDSRVGSWVDGAVDWEKVASSIDIEKIRKEVEARKGNVERLPDVHLIHNSGQGVGEIQSGLQSVPGLSF